MTAATAKEKQRAREGAKTEINVEQLIGRHVRDSHGKNVGRIEEVIAEIRDTDWVVVEVHLGRGALLERLVDLSTLVPVIGTLAKRSRKRYRLAWSELDLTDPDRPRALVIPAAL